MDPVIVNEPSTLNSSEEIHANRPIAKGILKKSLTSTGQVYPERHPLKRTATSNVARTTRVTFSDRAKNIPISTIFEVDHLVYDDPGSPKGGSCTCLTF